MGDDRRVGLSQRPCSVFPPLRAFPGGGPPRSRTVLARAAAGALPRRFSLFVPEGARKNVPGAPSSVPQTEEGAARSPAPPDEVAQTRSCRQTSGPSRVERIRLVGHQRMPRALRFHSAAFRPIALGVTLAFAVAQGVVGAQPAWAEDGGGGPSAGGNGGASAGDGPSAGGSGGAGAGGGAGPSAGGNGGANGGGGHGAPSAHSQWFGSTGQSWLSEISIARLAAPLRVILKRTQRASAHSASDLVKTGQSPRSIGSPGES